ncbi:uncharacterized protein [Elaeis guineensis]|uniref:uncharacterized protein n=1 Tax=Elaeis guineensis var. tenera TaxID=51953 RepID=UPI003C6D51D1
MKYEPIPITDDEDIEIIFVTVSLHPCLSSVELYIDVQPIEDTRPILDLNDYEVADRDIPITTQGSERTDNIHEDDMNHDEDEMDHDVQEPNTSHYVECHHAMESPNFLKFDAPSGTFKSIDWVATNLSISSALQAPRSIWKRGEELCKGLHFADNVKLKTAVKQYSIDAHHEFKVIESELKLWVIKCKNKETGCNWMLRAVKRYDYFEITCYIGPHTCISAILSKLWETKQKAMALVYGDWDKSYDLLPKWFSAVQEFNPGSWVKFISNPTGRPTCAAFDYAFWSFAPSIEGFKHCRLIISIDATFLYRKYHEKLMIATVDENNQIFLLAFAIVDEEFTDTWGCHPMRIMYIIYIM